MTETMSHAIPSTSNQLDIYQLPTIANGPAAGSLYRDRMLNSIAHAIGAARQSPCAKSKRGAATISTTDHVEAGPFAACNRPPSPLTCGGNAECIVACGRLCNHAEERVVVLAAKHREAAAPMLDVLHIEVDVVGSPLLFDREGKPRRPSCITCARLMQVAVGRRGLALVVGARFHD